jgi:hypothetical protein
MKNYIKLFLIALSCYSCSGIKESIIDPETGAKIAGFDKNCLYHIGKTKRGDLSNEQVEFYKKDSLLFSFSMEPQNAPQECVMISAGASGKYVTTKGIKSGDPIEKILKTYGKPKARVVDYGKDEKHGIHWVYYGLFYENLSFFTTDESSPRIIGFSVTKGFGFEKKYIKK